MTYLPWIALGIFVILVNVVAVLLLMGGKRGEMEYPEVEE